MEGVEKRPFSCTADGRFLLYTVGTDGRSGTDVWALPLTTADKPFPLLNTSFEEGSPAVSHDLKWLVYTSTESGRTEVFVAPFSPGAEHSTGKRQISTDGGLFPIWRDDGQEIFYVRPDGTLISAEVSTLNGMFRVGKLAPLFGGVPLATGYQYDATRDGKNFLVIMPPDQTANAQPITVVQNWLAALKK